jgi:ribosomal protein S18 acetylase RimI-like enzyme
MPAGAATCLCPACLAREPMILPAEPADAAEILELQHLAYQGEGRLYGNDIPPLRQTLGSLAAHFADTLILKAVKDGRILGSVRARPHHDTAEIGRLIVHPSAQRRGLGSRLMATIESAATGVARFELFTGHLSDGNLRFYRRLGYREFHRAPVRPGLTLVFLEKDRAT